MDKQTILYQTLVATYNMIPQCNDKKSEIKAMRVYIKKATKHLCEDEFNEYDFIPSWHGSHYNGCRTKKTYQERVDAYHKKMQDMINDINAHTRQNVSEQKMTAKRHYPKQYKEDDFPSIRHFRKPKYTEYVHKFTTCDKSIRHIVKAEARKDYPDMFNITDFPRITNAWHVLSYKEIVYRYNHVYTKTGTRSVMKKKACERYPDKYKESDFKTKKMGPKG